MRRATESAQGQSGPRLAPGGSLQMPVVVTLEGGDTARTLMQPHGSRDMLTCPQLQSRRAQSRPRSTSVIYTGDRNSSNGNFIVFFLLITKVHIDTAGNMNLISSL